MVDTRDLKSLAVQLRTRSSRAAGTKKRENPNRILSFLAASLRLAEIRFAQILGRE